MGILKELRKRPLVILTVALSLGIMTSAFSKSFILLVLLLFSFILFAGLFWERLKSLSYILLGAAAFFVLGAFQFHFMDNANKSRFDEYDSEPVTVRGYIDTEADSREYRVYYVLKVEELLWFEEKDKPGGRVLLSMPKDAAAGLEYGDEVSVEGDLFHPKGERNPGGFDYRMYLNKSGISAIVSADGKGIHKSGVNRGNPLIKASYALRGRIINVMDASLPKDQAGLLSGMLIGYEGGLDKTTKENFSDSGLSHLMAVSGTNVAFIILPFVFLFKKLHINLKTGNLILIAILVVFTCVAGFSASVLRAVIMAVVLLTGQIIMREPDIATSISFAALVLLVFNPYSLFDIGFQLSFAATISLVMFYPYIKEWICSLRIPSAAADVLAVTIAAQIGVVPITAYYFNKISVVSLFSNLLAVPLAGIVTVLGLIMAVVGQISVFLSQMIGYVNCTLLTFILFISKYSGDVPYAVLRIVTPPVLTVILYYSAAVFFLWYMPSFSIKINKGYCSAAVIAMLFVMIAGLLLPGKLEVVFLDVGEGDSAFIRSSAGKTVLIDGGGYSSRTTHENGIGDTVVIPFLLKHGVTSIDTVIASHGHDDHIQGLFPVLEQIKVKSLILPDYIENGELKKFRDICEKKGISVVYCGKGDIIELDKKTFFKVLYPGETDSAAKTALNDTSLVLKLVYGDTSILFSGDISGGVEKSLVDETADTDADILKVSHHGSGASTTIEFLKAVNPASAIVSVGKNSFGHPSQGVIQRLKDEGVYVFRTDEYGAVMVNSDGRSINIKGTVK